MPAPSTVTLPDGRSLAYDDVGAPDGEVVVYLHGAPDCRLARHPDDGLAARAGVRLLAVDRPGYGHSDPARIHTFSGVATDVGHLLDTVGVERCRLLAWSAGGPPALAAAAALGERCAGVTLYAASPPLEAAEDPAALDGMPRKRALMEAALEGVSAEEIAAEVGPMMLPVVPVPADLAVELVRESLGSRARADVESVPGMVEALAAAQVESASLHGRAGVEHDMRCEFSRGHAGEVLAASCPVRLVYGSADGVAGPPIGEWYLPRLEDATLEIWDGGTHHSLFPRWAELIAL
jgi:pimeloyl-ACP methyl ester carboxylesterase